MEQTISFTITQWLQIATVLLTGLLAGLFYGYDCSVIKGLGALPDEMYLRAFQSIDKEIQNPYFFLSFIGSLIVLPICCWFCYKSNSPASFYFSLAALVVYAIGAFGITAFGNVPLNDTLKDINFETASVENLAAIRSKFENTWNNLHHIRTYASILSFLLTILSCIKRNPL